MDKKCATCGKQNDLFELDFEPGDTEAGEKFSKYVCGSCWEVIATIAKRAVKILLEGER